MKKLIAFLLAMVCVMSAFTLVPCANNKNNNNGGGSDIEADEDYPLPADLHFDNEVINFVTGEGKNGTFSERSITVDEDAADDVDVKIWERNQFVQEKLGVEINLVDAIYYSDMMAQITPSLRAGGSDYDVIGAWMYGTDITLDGLIYNLSKLDKENANYIHFDADYWSQMYINAIAYQNNIYWLTGDLSLRFTSGMFAMFVNKTLYAKYCEQEFGNIFDIVREGRWTNEVMQKMSALVYEDRNQNEKADIDDQLGFMSSGVAGVLAFMVGNGLTYTKTNTDGSIEWLLNETNSDLINAMSAAYTVYKDTPTNFWAGNDDDIKSMQTFAQGTVLFVPSKIFTAETYLREMTDDYCIIPLPKLNESQKYHTMIHDHATTYGLNWALEGDHLRAVAATLELMAYQSHKTVMPAYYDSALKWKYTRDDDTADMIDAIRDSVYLDFGMAWDMTLTNLYVRESYTANPASQIKKMSKAWKTKFDKLIDDLTKLETMSK